MSVIYFVNVECVLISFATVSEQPTLFWEIINNISANLSEG